jgi:uncharacterized protein (DUF952 family)
MDQIAYKIMSTAEFAQMQRDGAFHGSPVDLRDGYIHLSTKAQLAETLAKHFSGMTDLAILEVDLSKVADPVRWEPSRGGQLFPHIYGLLPIDAVQAVSPAATPLDQAH